MNRIVKIVLAACVLAVPVSAVQADGHGRVVHRAVRGQPVQEPQPLLGEGHGALRPATLELTLQVLELDLTPARVGLGGAVEVEVVLVEADLLREARTPGVSIVDMSTWVCSEHGRVTRNRTDEFGGGF